MGEDSTGRVAGAVGGVEGERPAVLLGERTVVQEGEWTVVQQVVEGVVAWT